MYRVAQECLKNISLHSRAKIVTISVTISDNNLRLRVGDDGVGFRMDDNGIGVRCSGLFGMQERVALLGGAFQIRSAHKSEGFDGNCGTEIDIRLPIPQNIPAILK